ncbi:MAG: NifB/NifX family molybdenum-iron cluster-binding protein [Thermodesulfobacteriota bacterium]|nr:NifB/NifX family molybdenum-iron cluster-binding protein [Thermodesulfobacteriota bacterium]
MKIVITSYGKDLSSKADKSFGRAKWFILADTETGAIEAHSNEQNVNAAQGAGIQAAQNVANLGAEAVLTGNVGPNAFRTLSAASIGIFIIKEDITVEQAISEWKEGRLQKTGESTIEGHWV